MNINEPVPDFKLPDLNGKTHRLSDYRGRIIIVNFWSCECPHSERTDKAIMAMFVQHMHRAVRFQRAVQVWQDDVTMLSIASNRNESAEALKEAAESRRLPTVLHDADCSVANLFDAQTTPHIFVIDRDGILRYRGSVDDVTFRQRKPTRFFLDEAVESLLTGQLPTLTESPAYGCVIVREV
ncbi:MAG: redoxin domain-containing protein [Chloroflexi bacterium]|nr:redoxin domain-containing protein [Chloroflexota bacterium]MBI3167505.1 redoxin domain-containing protein [Chloroflexota bacterium]